MASEAPASSLLERDEAFARLEEALAAARGEGRLVFVSASPGIGKSTLIRAFCADRADDARTLVGWCDRLRPPRPLASFLCIGAAVGGHLEHVVTAGEDAQRTFADSSRNCAPDRHGRRHRGCSLGNATLDISACWAGGSSNCASSSCSLVAAVLDRLFVITGSEVRSARARRPRYVAPSPKLGSPPHALRRVGPLPSSKSRGRQGVRMPRYVVERTFPEGLDVPPGLNGIERCLEVMGRNADAGVTWLHSYVSDDRAKTFCVYEAPTPEAIRKSAARNDLPVDRITEVSVLDPHFYRQGGRTSFLLAGVGRAGNASDPDAFLEVWER